MNEHELTVEESIMECPTCNLQDTTKNEFIHNRKRRHVCKDCGRQFVENPPMPDSSATRNGFGWHLTAIPERLSGCIFGVAIVPVLRHCHQSTVNALFVTLIFGLHMSGFFPKTDAVSKEIGKMNRIERFNLTLRKRIFRLVRKTLSFFKKIEAHNCSQTCEHYILSTTKSRIR